MDASRKLTKEQRRQLQSDHRKLCEERELRRINTSNPQVADVQYRDACAKEDEAYASKPSSQKKDHS